MVRQKCVSASWSSVAFAVVWLVGCAAPVEHDDEDVASTSEALYEGSNFRVGITGIKYVGSRPYATSQVWTGSAVEALASSSSYSNWTTTLSGLTGIRLGVQRLDSGQPTLHNVDTRIVIGMHTPNAGTYYVYSAWLSEVPAIFSAPIFLVDSPDRVMIGLEERPWPAPTLSMYKLQIGLLNAQGESGWTRDTGSLAQGETSWSPTIDTPTYASIWAGITSLGAAGP